MEEKELDAFIAELEAAGATDDEITAILDEKLGSNVNKFDAVGTAIGSVSPEGKALYDFGRTIYSGFTDTVPQTLAQANEVRKSSMYSQTLKDYIKNNKSAEFQRYVREREPEYQGFSGLFKPFGGWSGDGIEKYVDKYGKQFLEDQGLGKKVEKFEENLPEVTQRRKELEAYVDTQKKEASQKLGGVVQDFRDIGSVADFESYVAGMAGQAAYQIPLSVATKGGSSFIMEAATVYDKQLDRLAQENGISREEVINRNLDAPAAGQSYAILAGALDAASAGNVVGAFKKSGGSLLKKFLTQQAEGVTEATQGVLEDLGAGGKLAENLTKEGVAARANEYFGGVIGGSFNFFGKSDQAKLADKAINEVGDTGDAELNGQFDAEAALTPQEEEVIKARHAQENLEELRVQEEKLTAEKEKLEEQLKKMDESDGENKAERKKEVQDRLNEINNAVQEQKTKSIPVREQTTNSEGVSGENGQEKTASESKEEEKVIDVDNKTAQFEAENNKRVRELEEQLRNIQPDQDITDLIKQWTEATQERDNARIAFEEGKKKAPKPEKTIHLTAGEAIKAQFDSVTKGMKRGVKLGVEETNKLIDKVREALKEYNLSDKQRDAILTKARNTDVNAFGTSKRSVSALNQFIDRVTQDSEYVDKINEAKDINRKLRKQSKVKNTNLQNYKSLAKAFVTINPEDTFINIHLKHARNLLAALTSPTQGAKYQRVNEAEVQSYITKLQEQITEGETREDEELIDEDKPKKDKLEELKAMVRTSLTELSGKDTSDLDDSEKQTVKSLQNLDPEKLDQKQLIQAIRVLDNIIENNSFVSATPVEALVEAQKAVDQVKEILKGKTLYHPANWYGKLTDSISRAWDELIADSTVASKVKQILGVTGLVNAGSRTENRTVGKTREVADLLRNFKRKTKTNALDVKNRVKITLYGLLVRHPEGADPNAHLPQMKENIEQTIAEWRIYEDNDRADAWQEAYDQVRDLNTVEDIERVWSKLNPEHKKLFDYFPKMFSELTDQHQAVTEQTYNKPYIRETNYNTFDTRNINGRNQNVLQKTSDAILNVKRGDLKGKQSSTSLKATRKLAPGSVYSDDFFVNQLKAYSETLYNIESAKVKAKLYNVVNHPDFREVFGRENADFLTDQLDKLDMVNQGLGGLPSDEFLKIIDSLVDVGRNIGAAYALGSTLEQAVKQTIPVITKGVSVLLSTGTLHLLPKVMRLRSANVKKLHDMYSIGTAGLRLGGIERGNSISFNLSAGARKKFTRAIEKSFNVAADNAHRALAFLTGSDRLIKQAFWNAYYLKRLGELGVKGVNINEEYQKQNEPERQEAAAYAEHMIAVTQMPSNPGELSNISRKSGNRAVNIIKNVILPFATYATEAKARMVVNMGKAIRNPSWEHWVGGVGGDLAEVSMYVIIQSTLLAEYKKGLENMWVWMLGLDDDDDEEFEDKIQERRVKSYIANGINTINPLAIGTPGEAVFSRGMNRVVHAVYKLKEDPNITYEKWKKETGGFAYEDDIDFGLLSIGYQPFIQAGTNWVDVVDVMGDNELTKTDDFGNVKDIPLTKAQQRLLVLNGMIESLSASGLNERTVFESLRNTWKKQLRMASKETPPRKD